MQKQFSPNCKGIVLFLSFSSGFKIFLLTPHWHCFHKGQRHPWMCPAPLILSNPRTSSWDRHRRETRVQVGQMACPGSHGGDEIWTQELCLKAWLALCSLASHLLAPFLLKFISKDLIEALCILHWSPQNTLLFLFFGIPLSSSTYRT